MKAKLKSTGEIIDVECVYYTTGRRSQFIPSWDIEVIDNDCDTCEEKKEFKIGEELQLGLVRLKCIQGEGCGGCFFSKDNFYCSRFQQLVGTCSAEYRQDETPVKFIEVKPASEARVTDRMSGLSANIVNPITNRE